MKSTHQAPEPPSLSVLVPIYNVEKYLRKCLNSLVEQTLENIEIICINDGSTDSSLSIIKEFMARDPRIVLINKKNSGYGDSMNQGLKKARGEYIGIVESDDWIEKTAFFDLYTLAKINNVDVIRANYYHHKAGKDTFYNAMWATTTNQVVHPLTHTGIFYQAPAIWSSVYRRKFLLDNDIKFLPTPGASYQDTSFNYKIWASAERAYFVTDAYIHYRLDNESSSVNSAGKVLNTNYEYAEIERFLKERGLWGQLAPMYTATKTNAYMWNAYRLSRGALREFLEKSRPEFVAAAEEGNIIREFFQAENQWRFARAISHLSVRQMIWYIRRDKFVDFFKRFLKSGLRRLRPTYAKQIEAMELIDRLIMEQSTIGQRLALLESLRKESK